ncbi:MAG TPA: tRNA (adenosine(37)-N6)-threonylcarbamoyltransferase complex transferase subunit TsaD [Candidatus Alectryocaccomicrobium excrementavium]|uniref:tRNA N6-adenosine threonylcarbamoyltransferase n=1 Tax=Candidatus Alectryocaccomicrobium excrementavium TaxID=2840668 RepID=A0A9D1G1S9_9FIRM|nr:tRNA (adenosine(37)-N6)-threonylcarbamoyltransferase complex transferase subunit TsaD [Candidatus Alectryocaccomicrobium excrementavium]
MRILAVESSCDETAMAVVEDGRRVLSQAIASQIDIHALYGGVVPEIASREHVLALDPLLDQVLPQGETVDAVAVTFGPGLVGALLTGVSWAKGFAYARGLPLIPVNHIEGHVSANYIAHPSLEPPFVCLVASGGHSHIVRVDDYGSYTLLGQTADDAAGEAFDKAARVIGIPYPGGPLLDRLAEQGDDQAYHFPRAHVKGKYDYSFSGVKTAVINETHRLKQMGQEIRREDFAASFRRAVVDMLVEKAVAAAVDSGAGKLALSGGVAANQLLRREARERGERAGLAVYMPPVSLCTDNAAMIGSAAYYRYLKGELAPLSLNAQPSLRLIGQE